MASYATDDYYGVEDTNASSYGITEKKWKPRKFSAKRDFPKAFYQVATDTNLSEALLQISIAEPQNISGIGNGIDREKWKARKVSAERDFPKAFHQVSGHKTISDVLLPVFVDLAYKSTDVVDTAHIFQEVSDDNSKGDLVPSEMDCVSSGSSIRTEMFGSDYDMRPPTTIEHVDTDLVELNNTDKGTHSTKRRVSAARCFPPVCGRNTAPLSKEELEKGFTELKNHWLTCKTCREEEEEEEEGGGGGCYEPMTMRMRE